MKAAVLVVDDEESIRFTFGKFLLGAGHDVETAASLKEGLARIDQREFDLIVADIILCGESGMDILRTVRERHSTCPVIFITGYPNLDTASEAVRLGAFDYLAKPVQKEALLRVTKLALEYKSLLDENDRVRSNLEAIFRGVQDAIIMVDGDQLLVEFNRAAGDYCGLSREMLGKPFDPAPLGCTGRCLEAISQAIETRECVSVQRFECRPDQRRIASLTASPLLNRKGAFAGSAIVVRDETRLVDLERSLKGRRQYHRMVGHSQRMQAIYGLVDDLAPTRTSVLITGESGTGKELLAEAIHHASDHEEKPLIKVNCSALSESLLESELFGHVKGSFTGAIKDRTGRFEMADGGTLFLDEIGDVSPGIQQRLLRVLQEREFERVGDSRTIKVDVRIIAATNKDLQEKIKRGEFREDLYYRLKVVEITLPPLRDRREDIPLLVEHYIEKLNAKLDKKILAVSDDVLRLFMNHSWPGNVRQLAHTLEHAYVLCRQDIITRGHLPLDFLEITPGAEPTVDVADREGERQALLSALEKTAWNKARAARLLNMSRRTIYRKLEEHRIPTPVV